MAYRAVTTQEAPLLMLQTRFQMDVEAPATSDVQPAVSPGESTDYFSISSEYQRQLAAASSLWETNNGIISDFRVRSPAL